MIKSTLLCFASLLISTLLLAQSLPSSIEMKDISGGTFTMGSNSLMGSPIQMTDAPEHQVTLSPFSMSEAEITNAQYVTFLNAAFQDGLIEIVVASIGPDEGNRLIQGTITSDYSGKVLYNLDGTRVMKDHDNADLDSNEFTGVIEPENPLNIAYIGYDDVNSTFYVKDPHDVDDFNWLTICDYQDYGTVKGSVVGPELNDFDNWAGAGNNSSDELEGWSASNPSAATKLPTQAEVSNWPVTFIRWWGAQAFVAYYGMSLPTEAQWEFAAKGGDDFQYAVHDGMDVADANWNSDGLGTVAKHHVREAISGSVNPFGLYNLGGNAWEWIADNYQASYNLNSLTDPFVEAPGSTQRCWRGGSWNYHQATMQSSIRFYDEEDRGNDHFGFRIVGVYGALGLDEYESSFAVYPNPVSDRLHISGLEAGTVFGLFDAFGNQLVSEEFDGESVDVSGLTKGYYFVKVNGIVIRVLVD